jgi:hypothetical protein
MEAACSIFYGLCGDGGQSNSADNWNACCYFLAHLYWHKPRQTMLRFKIEGPPDDHFYKPKCLFHLSRLFGLFGNYAEEKRLLIHTIEIERRQEDGSGVTQALRYLSDVNRHLGLYEEGEGSSGNFRTDRWKEGADAMFESTCLAVV